MSSPSCILTPLSDLIDNPKLAKYDHHLCRDIHIQLDKEARKQGLSYEERFEMVKEEFLLIQSKILFTAV
jgi:hypothetical protein